jgi:hypothetical protein
LLLMAEQKTPLRRGRKPAGGDKRKFLATLDPEVIKNLKLAAILDGKSASEILEKATTEWLERRKSKAKKSSDANDV